MKRLFFAPLVILALLAGTACAPPVTIQTPAGKAAYTADQVVLRINELQSAAIQANANGALPTATTRLIVQFAVTADKTLKEIPNGWQSAVIRAWNDTKTQLPATSNPALSAAISAVDVVLAGFQ